MNQVLPQGLCEALLADSGPAGIIVEVNDGTAVVIKTSTDNCCSFRGAAVRYRYTLALYEEGPVLCLALEILDNPASPFYIETFLDVAKPEDRALAEKLVEQEGLALHFYDYGLSYHFTKTFRHRQQVRAELNGLIQRALGHLAALEQPDWMAARARFMREVAMDRILS